MQTPFALWITGPPGSGKSTIAGALVRMLRRRDVDPAVLDADTFREHFAPHGTPLEEDRVLFYRGMVEVARMFVERNIPVILDATGALRAYRAPGRELLTAFAEVFVDCPAEICAARIPKGSRDVVHYEPPIHPEVRIRSDHEDPESAAKRILDFLIGYEWVPARRAYRV